MWAGVAHHAGSCRGGLGEVEGGGGPVMAWQTIHMCECVGGRA